MYLKKIARPDLGSFDLAESRIPPFYQSYQNAPTDQSPIIHYFRIIQKRKWLVIATATIIFSLAVISTLRETKLYEARSRIAIFPENPNVLGLKDGENPGYYGGDDDTTLDTQVEILRSDALALKVIESMRLDQNPSFTGTKPPATSSVGNDGMEASKLNPDPAKASALIGEFRGGLTVQMVPRTRIVELRYMDADPRLATQVVNELAKTFIEENFRTKYETATQTSDWLSKEMSDVQLKMEASEEKLVRYQKQHGILGIDEKQNIVTTKLDSLNKDLTDAESDRMQKEADYRQAGSGDSSAIIHVANSAGLPSLLDKLQEKEADLNEQLAEVTTAFGSAYPKTEQLQNQLKQVQASMVIEEGRIREKIKNRYLTALQREKLLQSAFEHQKQDANDLNQSAIEFMSLKRDAESNRQLYLNMLQRLKEAGVTAGLRSSNIRVVDVARVPTHPIKPDVSRNILMGLLLGLVGGIGLAFLMDTLDSTVRSLEEITAISALPALGTIPRSLAGSRKKGFLLYSPDTAEHQSSTFVTCADPHSQAAESYRALRTSILLSASSAPPKVLLITSAMQEEGKTTISANSAIVLAQKGNRVLLIDADLRRPGLGQMLGLRSYAGLSTILSGVDTEPQFITAIPDVPTLTVLPAGPIPPNPAELLSSDAMKSWLMRWRVEFDYIVIDSPPCLSVTDAVALSVEADKVILVARSGQTTKAGLRRASELLHHVNANVMGVVLNCLDSKSDDYYTYYHSSKYSYSPNGKEAEPFQKAIS